MKELKIFYNGKERLVKYKVIDHGGVIYAKLIDRNGREHWIYKMHMEGNVIWRGGINSILPTDFIEMMYNDFNNEVPEVVIKNR